MKSIIFLLIGIALILGALPPDAQLVLDYAEYKKEKQYRDSATTVLTIVVEKVNTKKRKGQCLLYKKHKVSGKTLSMTPENNPQNVHTGFSFIYTTKEFHNGCVGPDPMSPPQVFIGDTITLYLDNMGREYIGKYSLFEDTFKLQEVEFEIHDASVSGDINALDSLKVLQKKYRLQQKRRLKRREAH